MNNSEYKKYQNVTIWDIFGACIFGAILGAFLAYGLMEGF
jgi:uncharacterized oligopeptide transporter (OPT) family protein